VLKWCEPIIGQGTVVSFDDWFYEGRPDHGEQPGRLRTCRERGSDSAEQMHAPFERPQPAPTLRRIEPSAPRNASCIANRNGRRARFFDTVA
jgi:hypothetical protein